MNNGQYKKGQISPNKGTKNKTGRGSVNYPKHSAKKFTKNTTIHKSKFIGVYFKQQKGRRPLWISQICVNYKQIYLGCFSFTNEGELEASKIYEEAKIKFNL